jgi:hypothetical protein
VRSPFARRATPRRLSPPPSAALDRRRTSLWLWLAVDAWAARVLSGSAPGGHPYGLAYHSLAHEERSGRRVSGRVWQLPPGRIGVASDFRSVGGRDRQRWHRGPDREQFVYERQRGSVSLSGHLRVDRHHGRAADSPAVRFASRPTPADRPPDRDFRRGFAPGARRSGRARARCGRAEDEDTGDMGGAHGRQH